MMRKSLGAVRRSILRHKTGWIVGGASILVLALVGGGLLMSWSYWREYDRAMPDQVVALRTEIDTVLSLGATDDESRLVKRAALQRLADDIDTDMHACRVSQWVGWQAAIDSLKQMIARCEATKQQQSAFLASLKEMNTYLRISEQLNAPLTGLPVSAEVDQEAITSTAQAWQGAVITLAKVAVDGELKQTLTSATVSIADVWQEIASAHEAKDQAKFEAAVAKLPIAYSSLQAVHDTHQEKLHELAQSLQANYEAAF